MAKEKNFETKLKNYLIAQGAWVLKTWGGGYQRSGIPDLIVCYKGKFLGLELKSEGCKPTMLQLYELDQIQKAGGIGTVLKPSDFEEFKEFLKKL